MRHGLKKEIYDARPNLRIVSPLTHWVMVIYAIFNIVFGLSLFTAFDINRYAAPLLIVNEVFNYQFWGIVFILLGFTKLWAIKTNNWKLAKHTLIAGVSVKAAWAIALTIRSLVSPGTLLVNFMWIALALIQMGTYIWFMPPSAGHYAQRRRNRQ